MNMVAACAEAIKNLSLKKKQTIICHDLPRSTKALLKSGEVDFALEQDIYSPAHEKFAHGSGLHNQAARVYAN